MTCMLGVECLHIVPCDLESRMGLFLVDVVVDMAGRRRIAMGKLEYRSGLRSLSLGVKKLPLFLSPIFPL